VAVGRHPSHHLQAQLKPVLQGRVTTWWAATRVGRRTLINITVQSSDAVLPTIYNYDSKSCCWLLFCSSSIVRQTDV
jgi:hypothetical protein